MLKHLKARSLFRALAQTALLTLAIAAGAAAQGVAEVDAIVKKVLDANAAPSVGVAVVRDGKVIVAKGYGLTDVAAGTKADENTGFQIASVTKQFTAAGIMLLVEEGKIKLDDPLSKHVADVPQKWDAVTIRQLLNQVSGIPNYTAGGKLVSDKTYTKPEIVGLVRDVPMSFDPGTRWEYSNTNYFLLGMVIEKVSGKSYPDYMRDRIFKPLGMDSSVINTSGLAIRNAAAGHIFANGKWEKSGNDDPSQPFAAGAIVSTPTDMGKWAAAVSEGKLPKKSSWDEAFAPAKLSDGKLTNYGFGWEVGTPGDVGYVAHSGGIRGFNSYHVRFPSENVSVVVLVNGNSRVPTELARDIAGVFSPKVAAFQTAQRAAKNVASIEDKDPDTSKFLKGMFERMISGEIKPEEFSPEMQKNIFPDQVNALKGPLGSQGGVKSFELLTAESLDGGKRRIYRATFASGLKARVNFFVDAQGKIAGAGVRPE